MKRAAQHLGFLDSLRGVAILVVYLYHCLGPAFGYNELPWGRWFASFEVPRSFLCLLPLSLGWSGVAIFFVVSGFCIHLSFARRPDWGDFLRKRFFRIYPPYLAVLLLCALSLPWSRAGYWPLGLTQLGTHLALVHNLWDRTYYGINPVFWSIAVEVQLYALYPLLLAGVTRYGWRRSLATVAALELGLRAAGAVLLGCGVIPPLWYSGLPFGYWFSWAIGAALAESYLTGGALPFARHSRLLWGGLAVASIFSMQLRLFSFPLVALLTATIMARLLAKAEPAPSATPRWSPLKLVGQWSFSIYLLHLPVLHFAKPLAARLARGAEASPELIFGVGLLLWFPTLAISGLSYYGLELPSIAWGQRVAKGWRARQPAPEPAVALGIGPAAAGAADGRDAVV